MKFINYIKMLSANRIVGELIIKEKYKFADKTLISEVVNDVIDMLKNEEVKK